MLHMPTPELTVSSAAAKRLANFDCWVFRDELASPPPDLPDGACVRMLDGRGVFLGYGFFSASSHIALRRISREQNEEPSPDLFRQRIRAAVAKRKAFPAEAGRRLVSSEADDFPGLIVDQYGPVLVVQLRIAGLEPWRAALTEILSRELRPAGILERSDKEFRADEGLPERREVLHGSVAERIMIQDNGLRWIVDPYQGHKTGFYLDQRDTRAWVWSRVQPGQKVLDVFAYTGVFGIGAAKQGAQAVLVERQEPLLEIAREQAALNGVSDRIQTVAADAFYWLQAKCEGRERYDWVLLDPPGLSKAKADVPQARQSLHRLLVHALPLLAPEGKLVLSICTYHLLGLTEEIVRIAAAECGIRLRIIGLTLQAPDHPWILQVPATRYLMSWVIARDT